MKYICDDEDLARERLKGKEEGRREAEKMIEDILAGRPLFVGLGTDIYGRQKSRPLDATHDGHTVWWRLQESLRPTYKKGGAE